MTYEYESKSKKSKGYSSRGGYPVLINSRIISERGNLSGELLKHFSTRRNRQGKR